MRFAYLLVFATFAFFMACGDSKEDIDISLLVPVSISDEDTLFVFIEGGTFITSTGDTVEIEDFRISRYEVTNRLYLFLADKAGIGLPPDPQFSGIENYIYNYPDYPVVNVSAFDAVSALETFSWRLLTDAEWEYAVSRTTDGNVSDFPWGELAPEDAEYPANYLAGDEWETRDYDGFLWTAPVDAYPLSDNGLACLAGNAAEWTTTDDSLFAVRGGSWVTPAARLRIDSRSELYPGDRSWSVGFRLAGTLLN